MALYSPVLTPRLADYHDAHRKRQERLRAGALRDLAKPLRPAAISKTPPQANYVRYAPYTPRQLFPHHPGVDEVTRKPTIEEIQRVVARQYGVSYDDLIGARRTKDIVCPRQRAMYLAKALTQHSMVVIGQYFGGRDHTTVLHAIRKIEKLIKEDAHLSEELHCLKQQLGG